MLCLIEYKVMCLLFSGIHGSHTNALCSYGDCISQRPVYDDDEFNAIMDKNSLDGRVFGPPQSYRPTVTVNCNITAGGPRVDGEQPTAWVSACVENEPQLRSIEPDPVTQIKKDGYGRLDSCDSGIGHGEFPSTDVQSVSQVSFTDDL